MPREDFSAPSRNDLLFYAGPFGLFILLQVLPGVLRQAFASPMGATAPFWLAYPESWVYPLQTVLCAALVIRFRAAYPKWINVRGALFALIVGVAVFVEWISPQAFFHAVPRTAGGFNPHRLPPGAADNAALYAGVVGLRFARLVLAVPALEEVFWRGFLLRYLVREDFTRVPIGAFTLFSFSAVAVGFTLEHSKPDWPAALAAGVLYNIVAVRTKSLMACVLAHAVTNLLLGLYIMQTHQWGFW
jgi:CAAX prenyl protease-like protein